SVMPWRSRMRSGSTAPERSRRSQVASRVFLPSTGRGTGREADGGGGPRWERRVGGAPPPSFAFGSGWPPSPSRGGVGGSRDNGWIVAVTRSQSSASSRLSRRTGPYPLGQQDVGHAICRHAASDLRRFGPGAPEGV